MLGTPIPSSCFGAFPNSTPDPSPAVFVPCGIEMMCAPQRTIMCDPCRHPTRSAPMRLPKNLGIILLAVWLILFGLLMAPTLKVSFAYSGDLLALLAIAAGVCLFLQRW